MRICQPRGMSHTLRPARHEDVDPMLAAYEWLFAPPGSQPAQWHPERARETLAWLVDADVATVLVAEAGPGALVGLCTVALDVRSVRYGQRAWVEDLVVDPARRSTGVGRGLLDAAKAWARERGATHLELDSGDARTAAHRFYERESPSWTTRCFGWAL